MKNIGKKALVGTALLVIGAGSSFAAQANQGNCACSLNTDARLSAGSITAVKGDVLVSGQQGFKVAESGTRLGLGSRVMVGPQSEAMISFGQNCSLRIKQNSDVAIVKQSGNMCVQVSQSTLSSASSTNSHDYAVGWAVWAGGGAGAYLLATGRDGNNGAKSP